MARPGVARSLRCHRQARRRLSGIRLRSNRRASHAAGVPATGAVRSIQHRSLGDHRQSKRQARCTSRDSRRRLERTRHSDVPSGRGLPNRIDGLAHGVGFAGCHARQTNLRFQCVHRSARRATSVLQVTGRRGDRSRRRRAVYRSARAGRRARNLPTRHPRIKYASKRTC